MRRAANIDANQHEIVAALRGVGASVRSLAMVGDGVPDLVVGYQGSNYLLEVKNGAKAPSARRLTPAEQEFLATWKGRAVVVETVEEALEAIGAGAYSSAAR